MYINGIDDDGTSVVEYCASVENTEGACYAFIWRKARCRTLIMTGFL